MKDIPGYEGKYAIAEDGRVWSYPNRYNRYKGHWKKQYVRTKRLRVDGSVAKYAFISLGRKTYMVHRLVAKTYLTPCSGKTQVNHKDGDGTNNNVSNLEWCNNYENFAHAKRIGLWSSTSGLQSQQRKINGHLTGSQNGRKSRRKFTIAEAQNIRNIFDYGHFSNGTVISKAVGYAPLSIPDGTVISKAVGYAVLSTEVRVDISKAIGYAVLAPYVPAGPSMPPIIWVF